MHKSLHIRAITAVCVIITLGMGIFSVLFYQISTTQARQHVEKETALVSSSVYYRIQTALAKPINVSLAMANDTFLKNWLINEKENMYSSSHMKEIEDYLNAYQRDGYEAMFLGSALTLRFYNYTGFERMLMPDNPEEIWFFNSLKEESTYNVNIDTDRSAKREVTVFINCPVKDENGNVLAVVGTGSRLDHLQRMLMEYEMEYGVEAVIFNKNSEIIITSGKVTAGEFLAANGWDSYLNNTLVPDVNSTQMYWQKDKNLYIAIQYIPEAEWYLLIEHDTSETMLQIKRQIWGINLLGALILVSLLIVVSLIIRRYNKKIADLSVAKESFELMNKNLSGGVLGLYARAGYPLYSVNDSFIKMLGYEREEFEAKFTESISELFFADEKSALNKLMQEVENGEEDKSSRTRCIKKDGSLVWVEFATRKIESDDGQSVLLSMVMDVSKLVELQQKTERQHKTIMEGISYSRIIQEQLLPPKALFEECFSDYALIWQPRDVVGGDIYWLKKFKAGSVLCVCDCTGHGTSGALLTMLVASALEASVNEKNCADPAQIVFELEQKLVGVLGVSCSLEDVKKGMCIQDGCDLAVLFIANDKTVSISSGNTNVFICDGEQVKRHKGQKLAVGEGKIAMKEDVEVTVIPYNERNEFYIASDGLFDQIGGSKTLPFGYRRFSDIILQHHSEFQHDTVKLIWQTFEEHRGEESRRDDVELVAFKP